MDLKPPSRFLTLYLPKGICVELARRADQPLDRGHALISSGVTYLISDQMDMRKFVDGLVELGMVPQLQFMTKIEHFFSLRL
ncbi:hypothetical protein ABLB69_12850 [Xenorhabdus khoisanae]|uniref:hypothetical protein n=1 Tax=Xenorhabdus khoisanae TaxID=880157 RepID=UPI0032B76687